MRSPDVGRHVHGDVFQDASGRRVDQRLRRRVGDLADRARTEDHPVKGVFGIGRRRLPERLVFRGKFDIIRDRVIRPGKIAPHVGVGTVCAAVIGGEGRRAERVQVLTVSRRGVIEAGQIARQLDLDRTRHVVALDDPGDDHQFFAAVDQIGAVIFAEAPDLAAVVDVDREFVLVFRGRSSHEDVRQEIRRKVVGVARFTVGFRVGVDGLRTAVLILLAGVFDRARDLVSVGDRVHRGVGRYVPVLVDRKRVRSPALSRVQETVEQGGAAENRFGRAVNVVHRRRTGGGKIGRRSAPGVEYDPGEREADTVRRRGARVAEETGPGKRTGIARLGRAVEGDGRVSADLVDEQRRVGRDGKRIPVVRNPDAVQDETGHIEFGRDRVVGAAERPRDEEAADTVRNLRHVALQRQPRGRTRRGDIARGV